MKKIEKFIREIYDEVIENNMELYRDILEEVIKEKSTTQYSNDID